MVREALGRILPYVDRKVFRLHSSLLQECLPLNHKRNAGLSLACRGGKVTFAAASLTSSEIYGCVTILVRPGTFRRP